MHKITLAIIKQASSVKILSDAPWVDVHPNAVEYLKQDGLPVEVVGDPTKVKYLISNPKSPDDRSKDIPVRTATTVRILLAPYADKYKELMGPGQLEKDAAEVERLEKLKTDPGASAGKTRATAPTTA
jgi:hypothetical protein